MTSSPPVHVEKLGDAMNELMSRADSLQGEEDNRFSDVVDDLIKIKVWQETMEASIGSSVPLFGREFPNLWAVLDYSVQQEEDSTMQHICELQDMIFELKEREATLNKDLQAFLRDVSKSFENVKAHLGEMTSELKCFKIGSV